MYILLQSSSKATKLGILQAGYLLLNMVVLDSI